MKQTNVVALFVLGAGASALLYACAGTAELGMNDASAAASGSGGDTGTTPPGVAGNGSSVAGNGSSAAGSESGGAPGTCSDLPSAALIASTPRDNINLEQLALKFSAGPIADQATYDRLVQDVSGIYSANPSLSDIVYFPPDDGKTLLLSVDKSTLSTMQGGGYHAWDCLNDAYVNTMISFNGGAHPWAQIQLKGTYNLTKLAVDYSQLPGVSSASAAYGGGDGSTICVTQEKDIWHYVFDRASGDCPAGCTQHEYHHFSTNEAGAITDLGVPTKAEIATFASEAACK